MATNHNLEQNKGYMIRISQKEVTLPAHPTPYY